MRRVRRDKTSSTSQRSFVVFLELSPSCKSCNSSSFRPSTNKPPDLCSVHATLPPHVTLRLSCALSTLYLDVLITIATNEYTCLQTRPSSVPPSEIPHLGFDVVTKNRLVVRTLTGTQIANAVLHPSYSIFYPASDVSE
jgi:hypothetical protein